MDTRGKQEGVTPVCGSNTARRPRAAKDGGEEKRKKVKKEQKEKEEKRAESVR